MRWLAKRFKYTRELEASNRTVKHWNEALESTNYFVEQLLDEGRDRQVKYHKLTIEEAETLLSSCVDYQRALKSLNAADPFQDRIIPIFEKYGIKIIRNNLDRDRRRNNANAVITGVTN